APKRNKARNESHELCLNCVLVKGRIKQCAHRLRRRRLVSRPKAVAVFRRRYERLDHIRSLEVTAERKQLREPELVPTVISVRRISRVASEVPKVFHQYKRRTELRCSHGIRIRG